MRYLRILARNLLPHEAWTSLRIKRELLGRGELKTLKASVIRYATRISQPLALISQIQRSGGSLLTQLFDSHGACLVHPGEIQIGSPSKYQWPDFLSEGMGASKLFGKLFELWAADAFREGYRKHSGGNPDAPETHRFLFLPTLQRAIFLSSLPPNPSPRDTLDAYMTSYFNAWVDYTGTNGEKSYIIGFTPRVASGRESVERFFSTYPDGYLIHVLRDPCDWYVSARVHDPSEYGEISPAVALWRESTLAGLRNREEYESRVIMICFEDLITRTEQVMKKLSERLGIAFQPSMLIPTFNGRPIRAGSSFSVASYGIQSSSIGRHVELLSSDEVATIRESTAEAYDAALSVAGEL